MLHILKNSTDNDASKYKVCQISEDISMEHKVSDTLPDGCYTPSAPHGFDAL